MSRSKGKKAYRGKAIRPQEKRYEGLPGLIICVLFTGVNILLVHGVVYERDMQQFYWTGDPDQLVDFFSYCKMVFIVILGVAALVFLIGKILSGGLIREYLPVYIAAGIYAFFIILSFLASDYKEFAGVGYNDQFEGTLVLLAYLIMLIFIINHIRHEYQVRVMAASVAAACLITGLIGISQATGHDFFQTSPGKHLITPASMWGNLDALEFSFQNNEIYQTVFNINYVSFYLAMIIPVCGVFLIYCINSITLKKAGPVHAGEEKKEEKGPDGGNLKAGGNSLKKDKKGNGGNKKSMGRGSGKAAADTQKEAAAGEKRNLILLSAGTAALLALMIFNFAGARSLGGFAGLGAAFITAVAIFNRRLLKWWKSVLCMLLVTVTMFAATGSMWMPEVEGYLKGMIPGAYADGEDAGDAYDADMNSGNAVPAGNTDGAAAAPGSVKPYIDYMYTEDYSIHMSLNGNELVFTVEFDGGTGALNVLSVADGEGSELATAETEEGRYQIKDERYNAYAVFELVQDEENALYLNVITAGQDWPFLVSSEGLLYRNGFGKLTALEKVDAYGFEDSLSFGSGRGYIWSRTLGMLKDDFLIGDGANTYCINFPHNDYAGKYNSGTFTDNLDIVVDKPHNMYMGMFQGTGGISLLAFLAIIIMYMIQSVRVLAGCSYDHWLKYLAAGIFPGIVGFLAAGMFNDSNVSVMPMFYGLLGTGFAVNMMIRKMENSEIPEKSTGLQKKAAAGASKQ